ncbi:MAG: UDP-glucose 4-epimerase GalE [Candidatus Saccharibacteria bacterium]|nr:UDP-glucose 4-epimerase GalE [Candidatus Saccharibacteria bacterium]
MKILVTGGTGYIGSHMVVELLNEGHEVIIIDSLVNSKIEVLNKIQEIAKKTPIFYQENLTDHTALEEIFKNHSFDLVIHFAGLKSVSESVEKPLLYYQNNLASTINLLDCMQNHKIKKIIFSSSATVYGGSNESECIETMPTGQNITNPYGKTKCMIEEILKDVCISDPEFSAIALRYFNPIGNHSSGLIGENPNGIPNNLMPYIMKVAAGELETLSIYGNDYNTPDGTCRRDFIHVVDLAKGHLAAIPALEAPGFKTYNLGTGTPTSVLEMVNTFEKISGRPLPHQFAPRRPGDLAEIWANPSKAERELGWQTKLTIEDAIRDTLTFLENTRKIW